jgi:hypothetical protein
LDDEAFGGAAEFLFGAAVADGEVDADDVVVGVAGPCAGGSAADDTVATNAVATHATTVAL